MKKDKNEKAKNSIYRPKKWYYSFSPRYLTFGFISPYMKLKEKDMMKEEDLPDIPSKDDPMKLGKYLESAIRYEEKKALLSGREPSLMRALLRAYYPFIIICLLSTTVIDLIRFSVGLVIRRIVSDLQKPMPLSDNDKTSSIVNFLLVFGIMVFSAITIPHLVFFQYRFIFRTYASLATNILWRGLMKPGGLIVRKSIEKNGIIPPFAMDMDIVSRKRNTFDCFSKNNSIQNCLTNSYNDSLICSSNSTFNSSFKDNTNGNGDEHNNYAVRVNYVNIYNVMMGDLFPCSLLIGNLINVLLFPLRIIFASYAISIILNSSVNKTDGRINWIINVSLLLCIITLMTFVTLSVVIQIKSGYLRKPLFFAKDYRVEDLRYILSNIRTIKLLNWESFVYKNLVELRTHEMNWRRKKLLLSSISDIFCFCSSFFSQAVLFLSLGLLFKHYYNQFSIPGTATVPIIFSLTTLFTSISLLPEELGFVIQGFISLKRIQTFIFSRIDETPLLQDKKLYRNAKNEKLNILALEDQIMNNEYKDVSIYYINATFSRQVYDHPVYRYLHQLGHTRSSGGLDLLFRRIYSICSADSFAVDMKEAIGSPKPLVDDSNFINLSGMTEITSLLSGDSFEKEDISKIIEYYVATRENGVNSNKTIEFDLDSRYKSLNRLSPCLVDLNIKLLYGDICFIIGDHGAGKSTFINSILGELFRISGDVYIGDKERNVDIINSNPWIPSGTLKEIILAGREYNSDLFRLTNELCQLKTDIESWDSGIDKVIEEHGNNLSNGQKSRVSLARSIYQQKSSNNKRRILCMDSTFENIDPNLTCRILDSLFSKDFSPKVDNEMCDLIVPSKNPRNYSVVITLSKSTFSYIMNNSLRNTEFKLRFFSIYDMKLEELSYSPNRTKSLVENCDKVKTSSSNDEAVCLREPSTLDVRRKRNICRKTIVKQPKMYFGENGLFKAMEIETSKIITRKFSELSVFYDDFCKDEKFTEISGHVKFESYNWYISNFFGKKNFILLFILLFLLVVSVNVIDIVIILWSGTDIDMRKRMILNRQFDNHLIYAHGLKYILVFLSMIAFVFAAKTISTFIEVNSILKSATVLHNKLLFEIINSPLTFFDSLDSQSLVNIFSMDLGIIDGELNLSILVKLFNTLVSQCYILWSSPICILLFPLLSYYYYIYIFKPTRIQTRESYRFLLNTYGPLCNKTECSIRGSCTIRNMKFNEHYKQDTNKVLYTLQKTFYYSYSIIIWRLIRTLFFGILLILLLFICPTISRVLNFKLPLWITRYANSYRSALVSSFLVLSLSIIISLPNTITSLITNIIDLEKNMCSVQRFHILQKQIRQSSRRELYKSQSSLKSHESEVHDLFPLNEDLIISDITMSYNNNIVLSNLSLRIKKGEHIGLIGRTGSGKSTLFQCILGNYKLDHGFIVLDGVNIESYSAKKDHLKNYSCDLAKQIYGHNIFKECLDELYSNTGRNYFIGYLPQNSIYIKNWTVRNYIDPFSQHTDEEIWEAIDELSFNSLFECLPNGLDSIVHSDNYESNFQQFMGTKIKSRQSDKGLNSSECLFSLSQLRLISFLRLYLNSSEYKLLLVDEPPINNDNGKTDRLTTSEHTSECGESSKDGKFNIKICISKNNGMTDQGNVKHLNIEFRKKEDEYTAKSKNKGELPSLSYLINKHFRHCIAIIIAHHKDSIEYCDKVHIMGKGCIEKVVDLRDKNEFEDINSLFKHIKN
ncbi:ABC transporter [Cryptosporidium ryanae]|uniref:ABC transporter n=1 Tax=Cryptosporidium ryanae TaxID=515981 RepID=UPI00351A4A01|nr:ABC transporter [Cryptosporidium ryanae]